MAEPSIKLFKFYSKYLLIERVLDIRWIDEIKKMKKARIPSLNI
jgi:hypothetical protein